MPAVEVRRGVVPGSVTGAEGKPVALVDAGGQWWVVCDPNVPGPFQFVVVLEWVDIPEQAEVVDAAWRDWEVLTLVVMPRDAGESRGRSE